MVKEGRRLALLTVCVDAFAVSLAIAPRASVALPTSCVEISSEMEHAIHELPIKAIAIAPGHISTEYITSPEYPLSTNIVICTIHTYILSEYSMTVTQIIDEISLIGVARTEHAHAKAILFTILILPFERVSARILHETISSFNVVYELPIVGPPRCVRKFSPAMFLPVGPHTHVLVSVGVLVAAVAVLLISSQLAFIGISVWIFLVNTRQG